MFEVGGWSLLSAVQAVAWPDQSWESGTESGLWGPNPLSHRLLPAGYGSGGRWSQTELGLSGTLVGVAGVPCSVLALQCRGFLLPLLRCWKSPALHDRNWAFRDLGSCLPIFFILNPILFSVCWTPLGHEDLYFSISSSVFL